MELDPETESAVKILLTEIRDEMSAAWFNSLKVGDKVYNYSEVRHDKKVFDRKLREGIIKEIYNGTRGFSRYVIVDNLTTKRQNKWYDFSLVKPENIQSVAGLLQELQSNTLERAVQEVRVEKTSDEKMWKAEYERLLENANKLLKSDDLKPGSYRGIYGAFNISSGECLYIGKSQTSIARRWREHMRYWKKDKPIYRQPLLTQYLYFFSDQIEWKVLLPIPDEVSNDLIEYSERRFFEKYKPIANSFIPNGTIFGRSVMEGAGDMITVSEWNPNMVKIKIHKGSFNGFSDGLNHFEEVDHSRRP